VTGTVSSEIRVRYAETDKMGVAHHASYLAWFEVGRVELLRALGMSYRDLEDSGVFFPVLEVGCRFRRPAYFDDRLQISAGAERPGRARLRFRYRVTRVTDGTLVAEGWTTHASTDAHGRPGRLPAKVLRRLEESAGIGRGEGEAT
jgi:acyl-CoA thioester hydrolase